MMMTLVGKPHAKYGRTLQCSEFVLLVVKIQHRVEIGPEPLALVGLPLKDRFLHNVLLFTIQIRHYY